MIKTITIILTGLVIGSNCFSQQDSTKIEKYRLSIEERLPDSTYWDSAYYKAEKSYGLTLGLNIGKKSSGLEFGFGKMSKGLIGHHMINSGVYLGAEFLGSDSIDNAVIAPKFSLWSDGGSSLGAIGLDLIYYSSKNNGQFRVRPQVGLGLMGFEIVYGYNIRFGQEKVNWINDHNIKIIYSFGVFDKKKVQITNREGFEKYKSKKMKKFE